MNTPQALEQVIVFPLHIEPRELEITVTGLGDAGAAGTVAKVVADRFSGRPGGAFFQDQLVRA
jgi:hypothetical protein